MDNVDFLDGFESWLLLPKKHSFLSRTSTNVLLWLYLLKNKKWEKGLILAKKHGLTPLENVDFLDSFKSWLLLSKKHSYLSRTSKNVLPLLDLLKNKKWEKGLILAKKHGLTALENVFFWSFFKVDYSRLKSIRFYLEPKKRS